MTNMEFSHGTVRGKDHLKNQKNNQDAYALYVDDDLTIGVVCDGCGSGEHSEVGAKIGANILLELIREACKEASEAHWDNAKSDGVFWELIRNRFVRKLDNIVRSMGGNYTETVNNYFLFTVMVAVVDIDRAIFASIGDGVIVVNGEVTEIEPFEGNRPPYVAYALSPRAGITPYQLHFKIQHQILTDELDTFIIGCDGVRDFLALEDTPMPNGVANVGNISQFWETDKYFANPALLTGRLNMVNGGLFRVENGMLQVRNGLLNDDTTLIVGRKKVTASE